MVMAASVGSVVSTTAEEFIEVMFEKEVPAHYFARALVELYGAKIDLDVVDCRDSLKAFISGYFGVPPVEVMSAICSLLNIEERDCAETIVPTGPRIAKVLTLVPRPKKAIKKKHLQDE